MLGASAAAALPLPERVTFPSLDRDATGAPVTIAALYFRPPQARAGTGAAGHRGARLRRHVQRARRPQRPADRARIAWTEELLADGYAVLWPDSFNPRGRRSVCTIKRGDPTIAPVTRRLDILGALAFAAAQPGIDRARIALVGWSHGGSTALAAVNGKDARIAEFFAAPRRAAAVARRGRVLSRVRRGAAAGRTRGCRRSRSRSTRASSTTGRRPRRACSSASRRARAARR